MQFQEQTEQETEIGHDTFGRTPRNPLQFGAPHLQTVFPFPKHSRL